MRLTGRSHKGHAFEDLSYAVLGGCIEVHKQLGAHCLEVDYQRALELALPKHDVEFHATRSDTKCAILTNAGM